MTAPSNVTDAGSSGRTAATLEPSGAADGDPFGRPVLTEIPELAVVLEQLLAADQALAAAVDHLVRLRRSGLVEAATGVGLDGWLGIVARRTGSDRRMLLTVAETLGRLPQFHRCFSAGELSWAQLRAVVLQVHHLSAVDDVALDGALAGAVTAAVGLEPDALASMVRWVVADLTAQQPASTETLDDRLVLQPRLDGSGGAVFGELGPVGFAALDGATRPPTGADQPARRRAMALTELCLRGATGGDTDDGGAVSDEVAGATVDGHTAPRARIHLLLRADLETLLALDDRPAQLLTGLAGGAMWTDAATARDLVTSATSLRLIVTRDGAPVGIGRRSRVTPGWLRDAMLALHDTCTAPGCTRPALTADVDHAVPWSEGGTTDVANLGPLCRHHNRQVERRAWRVRQRPDGTRLWAHPATGLTTVTRPDRPPPEAGGRPRAAPVRDGSARPSPD